MLHLEIQKGEEAMKTSNLQKHIGGTTVCIKRLAIANTVCGQLISNDTYFSDSWFCSIKTTQEMAAAGFDYCGPAKTTHKGFCLAKLERLMKYLPRGSYLVMNITPIFNGEKPLLDIGYK